MLSAGEAIFHKILDSLIDILAKVNAHIGVEAIGAKGGVVTDIAGYINASRICRLNDADLTVASIRLDERSTPSAIIASAISFALAGSS